MRRFLAHTLPLGGAHRPRPAGGLSRALWIILAVLVCCATVNTQARSQAANPLRGWNSGPTRTAIVQFVTEVTTEGGPSYVPPAERIAVFSNDGTLVPELPMSPQLAFALDRVKALAPKHPQWRTKEPFRSALDRNMKSLAAHGTRGLLELMMAAHSGMSTGDFERTVLDWLPRGRNPRLNRLYSQCVYQPMQELLGYLRANNFTIYVVSGGDAEFMRVWAGQAYGIPPGQVIGSTARTKFEMRKGEPLLIRRGEADLMEGKAAGIYRFIGHRPIAAFGNSDADMEMMEWTGAGEGRRLVLLLHHTDSGHEFAYDRKADFGRLDKGLDAAKKKGWVIADMTKDWNQVFTKTVK